MENASQPDSPPPSKLLLELGPLLLFFFANWKWGIFVATGVFMVAISLALLISWKRDRKVPPMMIFTAVLVLVFGGLTIAFQDEIFIMVKVTIVNMLFAAILLFGLLTGRALLKTAFGHAFQITEQGWKTLTIRWIVFFLFMAVLNEVVWRNVSPDRWVTYKVFGQMGLSFLFLLSQIPLLQKHQLAEEQAEQPG